VIAPLDGDELVLQATTSKQYVDAGAECSDALEQNLNREVRVSGDVVNLAKPGRYVIRYSCANSGGVEAEPAFRYVFVRNTRCPVCTMNEGPEEVEASFPYQDAGVVCTGALDGTLPASSIQVTSTVDTDRTGTYTVSYIATDSSGNRNTGTNVNGQPCTGGQQMSACTRVVVVVDTLKPVVSLMYPGQLVQSSADESERSTAKDAHLFMPTEDYERGNPANSHSWLDHPDLSLMEEAQASTDSTPWFAGALAAVVAGAALLVFSSRMADRGEALMSVPV
jgi:hypothetical protein